jgi:hypothetical protein
MWQECVVACEGAERLGVTAVGCGILAVAIVPSLIGMGTSLVPRIVESTLRIFTMGWLGCPHNHCLMVKETPFEFLPLHALVDATPIALETNVVPPSGGLSTKTNTVPGCAMSLAVTEAINCWLLTKLVTRGEPFQFTNRIMAEIVALDGQ